MTVRSLVLASLLAAVPCVLAQQPAAYRVEFTLQQSQGGQPAEAQHYSLLLNRSFNSSNEVKLGGRIPIKSGADSITYQHTGMNLQCSLRPQRDLPATEVGLDVSVDITSLVPNSNLATPSFTGASAHVDTAVPLGVDTTVAQFEDVGGHHSYELKVRVTAAQATP